MRNIDEHTITRAFVQRLDRCDNPRLKEVLTALVSHLHDFAREVRLTEAEWMAGIQFLTRTGQMCDDRRQEFILLSDTLGLSMLTIALNHAKPPGCTEATVVGPFHTDDAPHAALGSDIAHGAPGKPLDVDVTLRSTDGTALADAEVDVWQADDAGKYDVQYASMTERRARAVLRSDAQGRVRFSTIVPTAYPVPTDGPVGQMLVATGRHPWRPAHLHFWIKAEGHEPLVTHLFREGDPYLDSDVVFGVRNSLIVQMPENPARPGRHLLRHGFVLNPLH
jgi:hydroxyquinol 1,2-dioxygenase